MTALKWLRNPHAVLGREMAVHGPTFRLRLPGMGNALVTGDPELVKAAAGHPDLDAGKGIRALRNVIGDRVLITLDGEEHRTRRRIIHPPFRTDLERWDTFTVETTLQAAAQLNVTQSRAGGPVNAYELALRISRRCILRALFGGVDADLERLVDDFLHTVRNPLVLFLRPLRVDLGRWSAWGRLLLKKRALEDRIRATLSNPPDGSIVAELVASDGMDADTLVAEVLALLLFGHDTGAAQMAWVLTHLASPANQEHQRHAAADQAFAAACAAESMRLCPVVVHLTRVARVAMTLGDHPTHQIAADGFVLPSAWLTHHNPAVWNDPERYDPERFLGKPPSPYAYFPFGIGARVCTGKPFVARQMTLILHTLLGQRRFKFAPGYTPQPARKQVLIVPSGDGRLVASSP